jgi:hypothetical protein
MEKEIKINGIPKLSKGGEKIVNFALRSGIPVKNVQKTIIFARQIGAEDGRKKIGPFGSTKPIFNDLEERARLSKISNNRNKNI